VSGELTCAILTTASGAALGEAARSMLTSLGVRVTTEGAVTSIVVAADATPATLSVIQRTRRASSARVLVLVDDNHGAAQDLAGCASLLLAGADEVVAWSGSGEEGSAQAAALLRRWARIDRMLTEPFVRERLIGDSPTWRDVLRDAVAAALFSLAPVLLTGPTGTGKELLASLVHHADPREPKRELVTVDCTTLSKELSGSELFGHEKGAFTGATASREGAVELADGGTLFLDEVGELPPELQAQFLRVLQERTFKRVGAGRWQRSDFRLVCATNRDLAEEVRAGRFRRDLYHRLAAMTIRTPSLAERREDILPLANHFLSHALGLPRAPELAAPLRTYLMRRAYDGNVRDLRQLVLAMARRYVGVGPLSIGALPEEDRRTLLASACPPANWKRRPELDAFIRTALAASATERDIEDIVKDAAMEVACEMCGSLRLAALRLGVSERTLQVRRATRAGAGESE